MTAMQPTPTLDETLDRLVNERLDLVADKAKIEQRIADLDVYLLSVLPSRGGRHEVMPGVGLRVQAPIGRWNDAKAREVLTPEQYALACEPKSSSKAAKAKLPGVLVDLCFTSDGKPSVRAL